MTEAYVNHSLSVHVSKYDFSGKKKPTTYQSLAEDITNVFTVRSKELRTN